MLNSCNASIIFCLFFFPLGYLWAEISQQERAEQAFTQGHWKEAIEAYRALFEKGGQEKEEIGIKLVLAYLKDQELEKAFQTYLDVLEKTSPLSPPKVSEAEQCLYQAALHFYLAQGSVSSQETAHKILREYQPVIEAYPHYYLLNFLVSVAYANLGKYEEFFPSFYRSFIYYPDSFIAYKTRAVLHIKLYERARTAIEKEQQRQLVLNYATLASQQNPADSTLYKLMIVFAKEEEKGNVVQAVLKKITHENIKLPRTDILFYIKEAVDASQSEYAEAFIRKAKEWYPYSRNIETAEQLLSKRKKMAFSQKNLLDQQ